MAPARLYLCNMHVTCEYPDIRCVHLCRSPGADPEIYFASDQHDRRLTSLHPDIEEMLYGSQEAPIAKCTLKVAPSYLLMLHIKQPCRNTVCHSCLKEYAALSVEANVDI